MLKRQVCPADESTMDAMEYLAFIVTECYYNRITKIRP